MKPPSGIKDWYRRLNKTSRIFKKLKIGDYVNILWEDAHAEYKEFDKEPFKWTSCAINTAGTVVYVGDEGIVVAWEDIKTGDELSYRDKTAIPLAYVIDVQYLTKKDVV